MPIHLASHLHLIVPQSSSPRSSLSFSSPFPAPYKLASLLPTFPPSLSSASNVLTFPGALSSSSSSLTMPTSSSSSSSGAETSLKCEGCGVPVKGEFSCPKCVSLGIKKSFFCSQDCFKSKWKEHKKVHDVFLLLQQQQQQQSQSQSSLSSSSSLLSPDSNKPYDPNDRVAWQYDPHLRSVFSTNNEP